MFGNGFRGRRKLFERRAQLVGVRLGPLVELPADPLLHLLELRSEFGDQVGFPLGEMLLKFALPLMEPRLHVGLDGPAGLFGRFASAAGNGLDLLGKSTGFLGLPESLGIHALAETLDFGSLRFPGVGRSGVAVGISDRHGSQVFFKSGEALFDGMELPTDNDLSDTLDLLGRGGCG